MRDYLISLLSMILAFYLIWPFYMRKIVSLYAYEPDKIHVIACHRESTQVVQCQHNRAETLLHLATKTQFQLRQVNVVEYQQSCGDNNEYTCTNPILSLETDGETIAIKDFVYDYDRANLMKARFDKLLQNPQDQVGMQMRYQSSWYTHTLAGLLMIAMMGAIIIVSGIISECQDRLLGLLSRACRNRG
jgi:hypothetical protein